MRLFTLILAAVFMVLGSPTSQAAVGKMPEVSNHERPLPHPSHQIFDFQVNSGCKGCVSFSHFWATPGFPRVSGGFVRFIRLYWSKTDFVSVTEDSPYLEMWIGQRPDGMFFIADSRMGNQTSGERLYFKVALVDGAGRVLHFMADDEADVNRHSVVVH